MCTTVIVRSKSSTTSFTPTSTENKHFTEKGVHSSDGSGAFDLIYCLLLVGILFCYQRSNAVRWWNKRQKFLWLKTFLFTAAAAAARSKTRDRDFLVKVSAPDFSFSFESCLVTCPLIAAVIPSQSKLCISTFTFFPL